MIVSKRTRRAGTRKRTGKQHQSLGEGIAASLREAIFAGRYRPGDPLTELGLSAEFGVSQAAVRDALSALAHTGLVRRIPNKGTLVTTMSERDAAEHTRLRTVLETIAASDAAMAVTPGAMETLERCVTAMTQAAGENDYFKSAQADLEFHREIWRMSGDQALFRVLDQVTLPLFAFASMNRSWRHAELRNSVIEDHRAVVEALRTHDPARCAEAMRRHFENSDARSVYSASKLLESTLLHLPKLSK